MDCKAIFLNIAYFSLLIISAFQFAMGNGIIEGSNEAATIPNLINYENPVIAYIVVTGVIVAITCIYLMIVSGVMKSKFVVLIGWFLTLASLALQFGVAVMCSLRSTFYATLLNLFHDATIDDFRKAGLTAFANEMNEFIAMAVVSFVVGVPALVFLFAIQSSNCNQYFLDQALDNSGINPNQSSGRRESELVKTILEE